MASTGTVENQRWEGLLRKASDLLRDHNVMSLQRLDPTIRTGLWNDFTEGLDTCPPGIREDERNEGVAKFTLARLYLGAAAAHNREGGDQGAFYGAKEQELLDHTEAYRKIETMAGTAVIDPSKRVHDLSDWLSKCDGERLWVESIAGDGDYGQDIRFALRWRFNAHVKAVEEALNTFRRGGGNGGASSGPGTPKPMTPPSPPSGPGTAIAAEPPISGPGPMIRAVAARMAGHNFISRFDDKMGMLPLRVCSPMDKKTYAVKAWIENVTHFKSGEGLEPDLPSNLSSRYLITKRAWWFFGRRVPKIVLESVCLNHLESFRSRRFDDATAGLTDLLALVKARIEEAEAAKYLHVISIASPTGWEESLRKELASGVFAANRLSSYLSVCLVDSASGEMCFNPVDNKVPPFVDFFRPESTAERLNVVKGKALEALKTKDVLALGLFARQIGERPETVREAFRALQRDGVGRTKEIDGVGIIFDRGS